MHNSRSFATSSLSNIPTTERHLKTIRAYVDCAQRLGHAPLLVALFKVFPMLLQWFNANVPVNKRIHSDFAAAYQKEEMKPFTFKAAKFDWENATKSLTILKVCPWSWVTRLLTPYFDCSSARIRLLRKCMTWRHPFAHLKDISHSSPPVPQRGCFLPLG